MLTNGSNMTVSSAATSRRSAEGGYPTLTARQHWNHWIKSR